MKGDGKVSVSHTIVRTDWWVRHEDDFSGILSYVHCLGVEILILNRLVVGDGGFPMYIQHIYNITSISPRISNS